MFDALKDIAQRRKALAAVDRLTDRDCSDIGASREVLRGYAAIPGAVTNRMSQMAAVFDADLATIERDRDLYLGAVEACNTCGATRSCKSILAKSGIERAQPAQASFCPNAGLYHAHGPAHSESSTG